MKSITIVVSTLDGNLDVVVSPFKDGLGVHLATGLVSGRLYRVTHLASSLAINGYFVRKRDAIAAMRRILTLTDWTKPRKNIPARVRRSTMAIVADYELADVKIVDLDETGRE